MDFGKPHTSSENAISQSNIRWLDPLPTTTTDDDHTNRYLDNLAIAAANRVATEVLLGPGVSVPTHKDNDNVGRLDTSRLTTRLTTTTTSGGNDDDDDGTTIHAGDLVVIQESFNSLDFIYCEIGQWYQNRNGRFAHNDMIGRPYGTKCRSREYDGYAFIYLLKPTVELWTRSLNHRTQVIHELDQSQIIWQLSLRPHCIVVESGTGSGALSHAILRAIAPAPGHLYTYEFNQYRSIEARRDFALHGLAHLVTVYHKDVCKGKTTTKQQVVTATTTSKNGDDDAAKTAAAAGEEFYEPPGFIYQTAASVDAVVLDLPEPWWAVPHAAYILKPNGRIASYSPCVEQTQRTVLALESAGFHSIQTIEYRLREHYVDTYSRRPPPSRPRITKPSHDTSVYNVVVDDEMDNPDDMMDDIDNDNDPDGGERNGGGDTKTSQSAKKMTKNNNKKTQQKKRPRENGDNGTTTQQEKDDEKVERRDLADDRPNATTMLVARPFTTIKGHTAFLTFATAGLLPQPNPNTGCDNNMDGNKNGGGRQS
jgi:tRNA (adenine57-N1/adenine58-N1)-methyltransferase catalytic subunit